MKPVLYDVVCNQMKPVLYVLVPSFSNLIRYDVFFKKRKHWTRTAEALPASLPGQHYSFRSDPFNSRATKSPPFATRKPLNLWLLRWLWCFPTSRNMCISGIIAQSLFFFVFNSMLSLVKPVNDTSFCSFVIFCHVTPHVCVLRFLRCTGQQTSGTCSSHRQELLES